MSLDISLIYEVEPEKPVEVYCTNITHNLNVMADELGCYEAIWRGPDNGYTHAKELISILSTSIDSLKEKPEYYKKFNPPNGWGSYETLLEFLEELLEKCKEYPNAKIEAWR